MFIYLHLFSTEDKYKFLIEISLCKNRVPDYDKEQFIMISLNGSSCLSFEREGSLLYLRLYDGPYGTKFEEKVRFSFVVVLKI